MRVCVVPERESGGNPEGEPENRKTAVCVSEHAHRSSVLHYYCNGTTLVLLLPETRQKWYQSGTTRGGGVRV